MKKVKTDKRENNAGNLCGLNIPKFLLSKANVFYFGDINDRASI